MIFSFRLLAFNPQPSTSPHISVFEFEFACLAWFAVEIIFRLAGSWQTATVLAPPHLCSFVSIRGQIFAALRLGVFALNSPHAT
jgi:hypothetical protein